MYPKQSQPETPESVRQVVIAVRALIEDGQLASLARVAEYLQLANPSAALERCRDAERLGLVRNVEPSPNRLPVYVPIETRQAAVESCQPAAVLLRWMRRAAARQRRKTDSCVSSPHVQQGNPDQEPSHD